MVTSRCGGNGADLRFEQPLEAADDKLRGHLDVPRHVPEEAVRVVTELVEVLPMDRGRHP